MTRERNVLLIFLEKRENEFRENFEFNTSLKVAGNQMSPLNLIFGEDHEYMGALAMVTDITERKKDEETLRRSEANLRTIFDSTTSYILLF